MARARSCVVAVHSGAHSPMRACLPFVGIRRHDPAICLEEKSPRVPCARRPGEGTQHGGWAFRSQVASDVTRTCTSRRIVNAPARAFCCYRGLYLPGRSRYGARDICGNRVPVTGGRLVKHARYRWLTLAEGHLTRRLLGSMVGRIAALPVLTG